MRLYFRFVFHDGSFLQSCSGRDVSAEGERISLNAGNEKLDAEGAILQNGSLLANQLIQAVFRYGSVAIRIGVYTMIRAGCFAIESYAEADGCAGFGGPEYEMQIAGVKAKEDAG